jgi:hypothetical protein
VACFPELTNDERFELSAYVQTNHSFPFEHIIPSTTTVRDYDEMDGLGWFPNDENEIE